MRAAMQHRHLGVSAQAVDDTIIIQVGAQLTALTIEECRRWIKYVTRELIRAQIYEIEHRLTEVQS